MIDINKHRCIIQQRIRRYRARADALEAALAAGKPPNPPGRPSHYMGILDVLELRGGYVPFEELLAGYSNRASVRRFLNTQCRKGNLTRNGDCYMRVPDINAECAVADDPVASAHEMGEVA